MSKLKDFKCYHGNDETANEIAQDLTAVENSHVIELVLVVINEHLTVRGAQTIANGLRQSHIKKLDVRQLPSGDTFGPNGNVLQPILEAAILHRHIEELRFVDLPLNDDIAETLTAILLSDDYGHALQTLHLSVGPNMTMDAAQRLATGLCHANVNCLTLKGIRYWRRLHGMSAICIAAMESVEKLVLVDALNDAAATEFGDALVGKTKLQSLTLRLDDSLSVDAARSLANGISRSHIVHLTLSDTAPGTISADVEDVMYVNGVARSPTIQHLSIGCGFCGTLGLTRCLSKLCTLTTSRSVVVKNVPALMTALKDAPHLTSLVLGQPFKKAQDMLTFCAALPCLTSLTDLRMRCQLAFSQVGNAKSLDVESRCIQTTAAEQLMIAVASHPCLVRLTLDDGYDVGFAGLEMIGQHLCNIKLKALRLHHIHDEYQCSDNRKFVQQAYQRSCQALIAGMQSNYHLHVFALSTHSFTYKVVDEINFYVDLNKSGRYLLHDGGSEDKVPTGLWCHILAKCGDKADFVYYHLREQPSLLLVAGMCHNKLDVKVHGPSVPPSGTKRHRKD